MSDAYPLNDLTGFQRDALNIIHKLDKPHGLAIKERLEKHYMSEVHHGRIYPNLDQLVEKGLVQKGKKDRRTNEYELTRRGERELNAYANWVGGEKQVAAAD